MKYSKIDEASSSIRQFLSDDYERVYGQNKPLLRHDVKVGILKPDYISDNSGVPHRWGIYSFVRDGFQFALIDLGFKKSAVSGMVNSIDHIHWQELLDLEWRYLGVFADTSGQFGRPFFISSLENEADFEEFQKDQGTLLIIDSRKILERIEAKL